VGAGSPQHLRALVGPVAHAPEALAALGRPRDHDAIADAHALDVVAGLLDDAGCGVPEDRRRGRRHEAAGAQRVGDADVDRGDAHHDLMRARRAQLDVLDRERPVEVLEDCSAHGHTV
jgi:hypothetical protein